MMVVSVDHIKTLGGPSSFAVKNVSDNVFLLQVYVLNPKQDLHGLGFDPYKHAPEFRGM